MAKHKEAFADQLFQWLIQGGSVSQSAGMHTVNIQQQQPHTNCIQLLHQLSDKNWDKVRKR